MKREAIPMLGPGKRFTLHTMSLLIFNVHLNSAQDSPCHLELNVLKKKRSPSHVVSIQLSELKLCLKEIKDIPFVEISFHPEDGAIGFTKTMNIVGNKNVLSTTFTPWENGTFNISGRVLFPRLIQPRDLRLNIGQLGSEIPLLARKVQLNFIPPTVEVSSLKVRMLSPLEIRECINKKPIVLVGDSVTGIIANSISEMSNTSLYHTNSLRLLPKKRQILISNNRGIGEPIEHSDVQEHSLVYLKEMPPRLGIILWLFPDIAMRLLRVFANHEIFLSINSHCLADAAFKYFGKKAADFYVKRYMLNKPRKTLKNKSMKTMKMFDKDFKHLLRIMKNLEKAGEKSVKLVDAPYARPYVSDLWYDAYGGYSYYPQRVDLLEKMNSMMHKLSALNGFESFSFSVVGRVDWYGANLYKDAIHPGKELSDFLGKKLVEYHCFSPN